MKKLLLVVAFAIAAVVGSVLPASAAGQVCYDLSISPDPAGLSGASCVDLP